MHKSAGKKNYTWSQMLESYKEACEKIALSFCICTFAEKQRPFGKEGLIDCVFTNTFCCSHTGPRTQVTTKRLHCFALLCPSS